MQGYGQPGGGYPPYGGPPPQQPAPGYGAPPPPQPGYGPPPPIKKGGKGLMIVGIILLIIGLLLAIVGALPMMSAKKAGDLDIADLSDGDQITISGEITDEADLIVAHGYVLDDHCK